MLVPSRLQIKLTFPMQQNPAKIIVVGKITGVYGIKGWLKVISLTEPVLNILKYRPWHIDRKGQWQQINVVTGRQHGKGLVVQLEGCTDPDAAKIYSGAQIGVYRDQLPALPANEYYWADLIGMQVINQAGQILGVVDHLLATGSNDVLVVKGEKKHLVPFLLQQVIISIEAANNIIRVDWDEDF